MVAGLDQTERLAGGQDLVVDAGRELRRNVELPTEFADVGDARPPPADWIPMEFRPAATKQFPHSGASPTW